ncbi:hypothetical protein ACWKSP_23300 [Micromonosporaceae bacterium Da 78-11]
MTASGGARALASAAACALAMSLLGCDAPRDPLPAVVASSAPAAAVAVAPARPKAKTVEYQGVQIDVPPAWERADPSGCEFTFEHWTQPGAPACDFVSGAVFYRSATFDPAHGPDVRRTTTDGATTWAGYTYAGEFAVYVAGADRAVVQGVLDSARVTAGR